MFEYNPDEVDIPSSARVVEERNDDHGVSVGQVVDFQSEDVCYHRRMEEERYWELAQHILRRTPGAARPWIGSLANMPHHASMGVS